MLNFFKKRKNSKGGFTDFFLNATPAERANKDQQDLVKRVKEMKHGVL